MCWEGQKNPTFSWVVLESSVVPRPHTSCPILHSQLRKCGTDQLVAGLLCYCLSNKSIGCVAARRREGHMPATHIFHKNSSSWPPVCWSLFYLP